MEFLIGVIVGYLFGEGAVAFVIGWYVLLFGIAFLQEFNETDNIGKVSLAAFLLFIYSLVTGDFQIISVLFLIFFLAITILFAYVFIKSNIQEELNDLDNESERIKLSREHDKELKRTKKISKNTIG